MSEQSLTLLGIETALLELIQYREDLYSNSDVSDEERPELLNAADQRVKEFVLREVKKADGLAYNLTEFRRRVGKCSDRDWKEESAVDLEIKRLKERKARDLARYEYLEAVTINAMQFIEQMEGRKRIEGECSTLALRDNPPKVEVTQEALLPAEFRRTTVTMDQLSWDAIVSILEGSGRTIPAEVLRKALARGTTEPVKSGIARVLKSSEKCMSCGNDAGLNPGMVWITENHDETGPCPICKGAARIYRGVPGARLVSGVRLEVK